MPRVSLTPVARFIVDTGGKFASGIKNTSDTGDKFSAVAGDTGGTPSLCEYIRKFSKKFRITLMLFSGAWGKIKKPEAKILVTLSL